MRKLNRESARRTLGGENRIYVSPEDASWISILGGHVTVETLSGPDTDASLTGMTLRLYSLDAEALCGCGTQETAPGESVSIVRRR